MVMPPFFIDANIIIYAAGTQHPYKAPCSEIMRSIASGGLHAVTNVEVLQELLHIYTRRKMRTQAVTLLNNTMRLMTTIFGVSDIDFTQAVQLYDQYPHLPARDAIHVATMLNNGTTHVLSADKDFDKVIGIVRIDPLDWQSHVANPC